MNLQWKRIGPTEVKRVGWRTIVIKNFQLPDGSAHEFGTKDGENGHCIATIAVTTKGKVVLAKQFRPGPEKIMHEIPGGGVEDDEDLEKAARRELLEETGYEAGKMTFLGDIYKDAYTNTTWHFYLATDCTAHPEGARPDEREFIEIELVSIPTLFELARTGQMTDTEAVFLAYEHLKELAKAY